MLTVKTPAKINLTLEVLSKRPDGYHEIRSVIQTINLCDSLSFSLNDKLQCGSDAPDFVVEESLVSRAAALLQQTTGCSKGARIEIGKRIPLASGLGGDSSGAAAILRGLNKLWRLGLSTAQLLELAPRLGSDVAFFLYGGTALVEGRGERVTPLPPLPHRWVVLLMPPVPRMPEKTRQLYASLKPSHYTDGQITQKLVEVLNEGGEFKPSMLFNTFENVAFEFFPGLKVYKEHFTQLGASHVHLTGSGPALFTMLEDKAQAEDLYTRCQQQGLESYLADTMASLERVE
ncbi:MAG: 4-(cytidine 5'-diphospho)-2-C-methyl-D-erythritol kinase [Dehalococcoidales bacterium]|nr:4-(cytidine 5'-diphospho)-2-C-methyl-D-erythritol kinase [Dehalococcoidales bacterium]